MTEDNVMEFCQWLVSEKGIEAGNLSDYINNNEEEVLKLAEEFKKPKFKVGGKVEAAAEMFKCGGKADKKKPVKKCQEGEEIVNDKMQNIRDRHKFAKKHVFAKGNTSYDMTIGHDLDFFNDFNGKTDTLIRKSVGFKFPKSYSNEDIGRRFEIAFPSVAKFFGYKSGFQKALEDIDSMQRGGAVDQNSTNEFKRIGITLGNSNNKEFEDATGRYIRTVTPKDTVWHYNDYAQGRTVYTTSNGYWGVLDDINGNNRALSNEEMDVVINAVESRLKNFTKDERQKHLIRKYGKEMMLPENFKSNKK